MAGAEQKSANAPSAKKWMIGIIGIGRMGHGLASSLSRAGFSVSFVAHRARVRADDLRRRGLSEQADVASLAEVSDLLVLSLPSSREVDAILQVIEALGRPAVVVDTTTSLPSETQRWAARLAPLGVTLCDAPVTGGPPDAEVGRLITLFGGDDTAWALAEAVVRTYSIEVVRAGAVGAGHRLKLLNNMLTMGHVCLAAEVIRAAEAEGVDPVQLREIASRGAARSAALEALVAFRLGDTSVLDFSITNAAKDLDYAAATFDLASWSEVISGARALIRRAVSGGYGDRNLPWLLGERK
jgi:3-hydroxyisobutyrate dehydrogenase-like beta-hydroxyacid dehydrogenase